MTGLRAWGVWALLALTGLAGCVGGQSASVETTSASVSVSPGDVDLDTGIRGTVMSTELSPIPEAVVQVDDLPSVKTDNAGVFEVLGLTPGDHSLVVQALGYASVARKVTANQGEVAEVRITLERLEIQEPYIEVLVRDGYDICSYALFAFVGSFPSPCPLGTDRKSVV